MDNPTSTVDATERAVSFVASMQHVTPERVQAVDLTGSPVGDLVSLKFGDGTAEVSLLGTLGELIDVGEEMARQLRGVIAGRRAHGAGR